MNAKENGIIPAIVVGVILSVVNIWVARTTDSHDSTATSLATLTERVSTLSKQVEGLTQQPYVRREDLAGVTTRVDGLDQRVGIIERASFQRSN